MQDHCAVLYNGDVILCCIDYDGNTKVGNVSDSSLEEILSSERGRKDRQRFQEDEAGTSVLQEMSGK